VFGASIKVPVPAACVLKLRASYSEVIFSTLRQKVLLITTTSNVASPTFGEMAHPKALEVGSSFRSVDRAEGPLGHTANAYVYALLSVFRHDPSPRTYLAVLAYHCVTRFASW